MFFKLVSRNSKRNRKENGLFFGALMVSVIVFYIVLSLSHQDVMVFLARMESDAVERLMGIIPVFYGLTLFLLFFLIYYASRFQLERRRHEFGVYLMFGMRRIKLFAMLLAEDLRNSLISLAIGLPVAVLLSELISLITARLVGIGMIGHRFSFSPQAALWTAIGFLSIKFIAFLILSGRISSQTIGALMAWPPAGVKRQMPPVVYAVSMVIGIAGLAAAYVLAVYGDAWYDIRQMGITLALGTAGTWLLFFGMRFVIGLAVRSGKHDRRLHVFHFRQIQETVIQRSGTLAVCSLLMLAALCCFGAGVAISRFYGESEPHVLDYTFDGSINGDTPGQIRQKLTAQQLDVEFLELFEMRVGHIRTAEDIDHAFAMEPLMEALRQRKPSRERDVLLNNLSYATYPYVISQSGYNRLLAAADLPALTLGEKEAAVYMDREFADAKRSEILNDILKTGPKASLDGTEITLTGSVQTTKLVTDRSITLSFALILADEVFDNYTQGDYDVYLNGILAKRESGNGGLMAAISEMNRKLDEAGVPYESYLQNMGRQLFYMVASSYITMYLAIIFLMIANTVIGVQFLMNQQQTGRRYLTLIRLGATHDVLCGSSRRQINWYFGLPIAAAVCSSIFGVYALLTGILSSRSRGSLPEMMIVSFVMILVLCVIEYFYIAAVKRASDRYLLTLMVPEREE